jgi:hypothetical protein
MPTSALARSPDHPAINPSATTEPRPKIHVLADWLPSQGYALDRSTAASTTVALPVARLSGTAP